MGRSQETFSKKEKEKKRLKKRQDKKLKAEERKANSKGSGLDAMMAYVDFNGNIVDTPPEVDPKKKDIDAESIEISIPKTERVEMPAERTGKVDFFDHNKGFGFINEDISGERYFVHIKGCEDEIAEGDKVTYELEQGMKGMNAVKVKRI